MIDFLIASGMTQLQLSKETGISQSAISRLICGKQEEVSFAKGKALENLYNKVRAADQTDHTQKKAA